MNEVIDLPAPAKINLFLHVTGRRDDGYHLIQTLFQFLDHGDSVQLSTNPDGEIAREDHHDFALPDDDLCTRAAKSLKLFVNQPELGATIILKKRIPPGTGLGAGSSNAASVLLGLNHLWQLGLSNTELGRMGRTLGADVPVFVRGNATWATGIGDQLATFSVPIAWYVVILPPVSVPTAAIFQDQSLRRDTPVITPASYRFDATRNDLEAVTRREFPAVDRALSVLETVIQDSEGSYGCPSRPRMSGSGAAVFLHCKGEADARKLLTDALQRLNRGVGSEDAVYSGFASAGSNQSTAHQVLSQLP